MQRGPVDLSYGRWFGYGFLAGALYAIARNPLGCLVWLIVLTAILGIAVAVMISAALSHPLVLLLLVAGIVLIVYGLRRPPRGPA